jgi:lipoprotein LprG
VRRLTGLLLAISTLTATCALSACNGTSGSDESVRQRLTQAKTDLDSARFISFDLTSDDLPDGIPALESAHGTGTHAPAFTGEVRISSGLSFTAPVVAVGGKVYAKLPFVSWSAIDPDDYGAPDPSVLMNRSTGLSSLLTAAKATDDTGSERDGDTVLTKIAGTVPGSAIHALFPSSADSAFHATFTLTDDDALHSVSLTGRFYGSDHDSSTYAIELDTAADPVTITPPQ